MSSRRALRTRCPLIRTALPHGWAIGFARPNSKAWWCWARRSGATRLWRPTCNPNWKPTKRCCPNSPQSRICRLRGCCSSCARLPVAIMYSALSRPPTQQRSPISTMRRSSPACMRSWPTAARRCGRPMPLAGLSYRCSWVVWACALPRPRASRRIGLFGRTLWRSCFARLRPPGRKHGLVWHCPKRIRGTARGILFETGGV